MPPPLDLFVRPAQAPQYAMPRLPRRLARAGLVGQRQLAVAPSLPPRCGAAWTTRTGRERARPSERRGGAAAEEAGQAEAGAAPAGPGRPLSGRRRPPAAPA